MNRQNIISAGRMMAIVVALLGAFHLGATFALNQEAMWWKIVFGVALVLCGLALVVLFGRVARKMASPPHPATPCRATSLGTAVLALGTLVLLLSIAAVSFSWSTPFSWMMAIVGAAIFIDTLCLRISLAPRRP